MYFIINKLLRSKYAEKYLSKSMFKGGSLVFFMLIDKDSGKIALKIHDLCQIAMCSLDKASKSYIRKSEKGIFPHIYTNKNYFQNPNILNEYVNLTKEDYPKAMRANLKEKDLMDFNFKENLKTYGKNDVKVLIKIYEALNKIYYKYCSCDVLNFVTCGGTAHYMFMKNLPEECMFNNRNKTQHRSDKNNIQNSIVAILKKMT